MSFEKTDLIFINSRMIRFWRFKSRISRLNIPLVNDDFHNYLFGRDLIIYKYNNCIYITTKFPKFCLKLMKRHKIKFE